MGTSAIDLMQSSDIAQLQTDVTELNTKLNALIVEFNKCSDDTTTNKGKIDSLITDVAAVNSKISTGNIRRKYATKKKKSSGYKLSNNKYKAGV